MYLSFLPATLLLSLIAAQTTISQSGTASACAAQPVLEVCLASTEATAADCASTDYQCLCQSYKTVLVCFNNCPNDSRYSSILSEQETYCNDMSAYATTTTTPISRPVSTSGSAATTEQASNARTTGPNTASQTATGTSSSASGTATGKSGAGSNMIIGAGQVMLGLTGVVGVML